MSLINIADCLIDFNQMNKDWPKRRIGKNHDLSRAIGLNKFKDLSILDATAGLARDAFIFLKLGAKVTLLERHPLLIPLLEKALDSLEDEDLKKRLSFIPKDAIIYLEQEKENYDCIYLDPMFSEIEKRATVKKEMQFLQQIVGENEDASILLSHALKKAKKRVVVKRHKLSPYLAERLPHHSIIGKSTRYDVYLL